MLMCESKIPKLPQHFQPFYINYNIGSKLMVIKAQVTICITLFKNNNNLHQPTTWECLMLRISNHHNQSLFHSLVAKKIPKQQQQQSNQNNNITHLIQMQKPIKKKKQKTNKTKQTNKLSDQTQHKTENPEFSFLFLDFLGNQTGP